MSNVYCSKLLKQLKNKKIAILGFGNEGYSTLEFLKKYGISCSIHDQKKSLEKGEISKKFNNIEKFYLGQKYLDNIEKYDLVFRTPGMPRLHPKLVFSQKRGVEISSQTKLFFDLSPCPIIAITGTKGKTTTSFLIYKILKKKHRVFLAGNFGKPLFKVLPKLNKNSLAVLELSSFQLQDLQKSPHIAVITNITSDHMDPAKKFSPSTHQNLKEYLKAKLNIIRYQNEKDFAIIHSSLKNKTKNIGRGKKIYFDISKFKNFFKNSINTNLKGEHNKENILAAAIVGKILKIKKEEIISAIKEFKGIEHRLEFVKKIKGISFYNDSAGTNPGATLAALKSFKEPIHLISGGSDKGLDYNKLAEFIAKNKNIKTAVLIGQIKNKLYSIIKKFISRFKNKDLKIIKAKTLKEAVLTAYKLASKNEVVLFSPAAASFDMFQNYAERGKQFKKIVKEVEDGS